MRRTSLVLAAIGGAAALAVAGAAIGATAADGPGPASAPVAVTTDVTGPADDDPGTADDNPGTVDDSPAADDSPTAGTTPSRGAPESGTVDAQRAGRVALARLGGGRIVEIEAETEHERPVWSVKVARAGATYEVKVDRGDGAVLEVEWRAEDGARRTDDGGRTHDRYDDHGGDDRYDDHGGDRSGDDD
ncbi:PepSY domain-containing protein [Micromonospora chaiyaphumensis]|uniref:Peptidase propeptide and YPEB domain-containing protein n=1 Tax=Micromonospora chaiyaphumensis TaxID=307119 RepID=A0A1C4ZCM2_9ACTN|nr:PepSY domain-containing protein [Micromonospora chaiyaphumensis]SCF30730.1 Peptidase propeptide and YPEB domain-containing protein [Micromonospora chaiyaphumensis]